MCLRTWYLLLNWAETTVICCDLVYYGLITILYRLDLLLDFFFRYFSIETEGCEKVE